MTDSALGFAHQISLVFLPENNEPGLIKVYRLPAGEAEQYSFCFPLFCLLHSQKANKIPAELAKIWTFKIIQKTHNSLHWMSEETSISNFHTWQTPGMSPGPEIMIINKFLIILVRQKTFHTLFFLSGFSFLPFKWMFFRTAGQKPKHITKVHISWLSSSVRPAGTIN